MIFDDFIKTTDSNRFKRLMEFKGDGIFEGCNVTGSKLSSIKRFHEHTNEYNRTKIVKLINNSVNNINKVHKIVIDYNIAKGNI